MWLSIWLLNNGWTHCVRMSMDTFQCTELVQVDHWQLLSFLLQNLSPLHSSWVTTITYWQHTSSQCCYKWYLDILRFFISDQNYDPNIPGQLTTAAWVSGIDWQVIGDPISQASELIGQLSTKSEKISKVGDQVSNEMENTVTQEELGKCIQSNQKRKSFTQMNTFLSKQYKYPNLIIHQTLNPLNSFIRPLISSTYFEGKGCLWIAAVC